MLYFGQNDQTLSQHAGGGLEVLQVVHQFNDGTLFRADVDKPLQLSFMSQTKTNKLKQKLPKKLIYFEYNFEAKLFLSTLK